MIGCLLLGTGCSDWLSVNPKDKVEQKEMFSDENGFKNALIGNYIMLKDSKLYGKTLTMEFCENLAQHWKTNPQAIDGYTAVYDYKNAEVERLIEDIYGKFYNTIVNINNLLGYVDNGILTSDMHDLIKGEALAMRAFYSIITMLEKDYKFFLDCDISTIGGLCKTCMMKKELK